MSSAVLVNGLVKYYKAPLSLSNPFREREAVRALGGITLEINCGETVALIGHNGSGKTTLLKIISALLYHDEGEIEVLGRVLPDGEKEVLRRVHYLSPDERSFYHRLSVRDNLQLFSVLWERDLNELLVDLMAVKGLLSRRYSSLSSGQKQRVALVRALMAGGDLYLLDEPTKSIDEEGVNSLKRWLGGEERGSSTVIMSFPREEPLVSLATRVIRMESGHVL